MDIFSLEMLESALEMAQCVLYMTSVSSLVTAALTVRIATTVCSQAVKQSSRQQTMYVLTENDKIKSTQKSQHAP